MEYEEASTQPADHTRNQFTVDNFTDLSGEIPIGLFTGDHFYTLWDAVGADQLLTFERPRHDLKDPARDKPIVRYNIDRLTGHAGVTAWDKHRAGARLKTWTRELDGIDFAIIDWQTIVRAKRDVDRNKAVEKETESFSSLSRPPSADLGQSCRRNREQEKPPGWRLSKRTRSRIQRQ